ncbi:MAG: hypothetical protein WBD31_00645, partial [Rubripirellula sp.]
LSCQRTAFINRPLYLQRCAGQGYSSQPANRHSHMLQGLENIRHFAQGAEHIPELAKWKSQISEALAQSYFNAAYQYHQSGDIEQAWPLLKDAMATRIKLRHLRLAVRMWLPRNLCWKVH